MTRLFLLTALALAGCKGRAPGDGSGGAGAAEGRELYERYCAKCHGLDGQARTPAAQSMQPPPAAFARGAFRHKSTPGGEAPTDADLARVIRHGVPGTAMAPWPNFDAEELAALVQAVRGFHDASPGATGATGASPLVLPGGSGADTKAAPEE